jgi:hypothetical protein
MFQLWHRELTGEPVAARRSCFRHGMTGAITDRDRHADRRISRALRPQTVTVCHERAAPGQASQVSGERHRVIRLQSPSSSPGLHGTCPSSSIMISRHDRTWIATARPQMTVRSPRCTFSRTAVARSADWGDPACARTPCGRQCRAPGRLTAASSQRPESRAAPTRIRHSLTRGRASKLHQPTPGLSAAVEAKAS